MKLRSGRFSLQKSDLRKVSRHSYVRVGQLQLQIELLLPSEHESFVLLPDFRQGVVPECLAGQVVEVLLGERAAASRRPLHVERGAGLLPAHFVRYDERSPAPLRECVVPRHRRKGLRFLVPVHDHHDRKGEGPELKKTE